MSHISHLLLYRENCLVATETGQSRKYFIAMATFLKAELKTLKTI